MFYCKKNVLVLDAINVFRGIMSRDKSKHCQNNQIVGSSGEKLAYRYLKSLGYRVMESNFQTALGEIDLVAYQDQTLIFVEVKTRRSKKWGTPFMAVTATKQKKIIQVALEYIQVKKPRYDDLRFDIISIVWLPEKEPHMEHFPGAFDASVSPYLF